MPGLVRRNLGFVLQREPNVVQSVQQALADEFIDGELGAESLVVAYFALLQINRDPIVVDILRPLHQLPDFVLAQPHREKSILRTVVGENVRERRRDHGAKTEIGQRPYRMFAGRSAPKVFPRDQNARAFITRLVQHKVWILGSVRCKPPVIKHELAKPRAFDTLQKLFWDDLVGVHINPVQRRHAPLMHCERLHRVLPGYGEWLWEGYAFRGCAKTSNACTPVEQGPCESRITLAFRSRQFVEKPALGWRSAFSAAVKAFFSGRDLAREAPERRL